MRSKRFLFGRFAGLILLAGAMLAVSFYSFRALLTDGEQMVNTLRAATNEVEIIEEFDPPEEPEPGPETYKKSISLRNTGRSRSFVRLYIGFSDGFYEKRSGFSSDGETFYSASAGGSTEPLPEEAGILPEPYVDHLPEGWTYIRESPSEDGRLLGGYFYYQKVLDPGETTAELVRSVRTYFADEEEIRPFDILVYAESIQAVSSEGQPLTDGDWHEAFSEFMKKGGESE